MSVLIPWYSARPNPIPAEAKELLQRFQSFVGDVVGDLCSLIFKEAIYSTKPFYTPNSSVCAGNKQKPGLISSHM